MSLAEQIEWLEAFIEQDKDLMTYQVEALSEILTSLETLQEVQNETR